MRAVLLPIAFATAALGWPHQDATRLFPTKVELVAVDVLVVDEDGRPVRNLRPDEFRVEVAGRPRQVQTAEFISLTEEAAPEAQTAGDPGFTTNECVRPRRLVLLVVDVGNIGRGQGREVITAADRMLDRLAPTDRIGLLTIPTSGPREEFTTDHQRIRTALATVVGRARFSGRVSLAEAIACVEAERSKAPMDVELCIQAMLRECGASYACPAKLEDPCSQQLCTEAWQLRQEYEQVSRTSQSVLKAAFEGLRSLEGHKVVLLISDGLGFAEMGARPGAGGWELQQLVSAATAARVSFYVVPAHSGAPPMSADGHLPLHVVDEDRRLHAWGLESLAFEAQGTVVRGAPERAFERVLRETSGYYQLGFEPQEKDRDGKARKLRVRVTRPGLVVRSRSQVAFTEPVSRRQAKDALVEALRAPTLATALPVRVAAWTVGPAEDGKVRLRLGAEIGGVAERQGLVVGYVLLDEQGRVAASADQPLRAEAQEGAGSIPYGAVVAVPPGAYTLRLAVRDGRGRLGSVEHHIEARLVRAGPFAISDLLLGAPPESGRSFRPAVVPEVESGSLLVHGAIYGEEGTDLEEASASFEVVSSKTGESLRSSTAQLLWTRDGQRIVQVLLPIQALPPGQYLARVVVATAGRPRGAVVRPFRVIAPASGRSTP